MKEDRVERNEQVTFPRVRTNVKAGGVILVADNKVPLPSSTE